MRVGHFVEFSAPTEEQELVEVGHATWRWNRRGHGDSEDNFILVNGRFLWNHSKNKELMFAEITINGPVYHTSADDDFFPHVDKYFLNGDG